MNHKSERFLYFHRETTDGDDSYFMVDTERRRVFKVCLQRALKQGAAKIGMHELIYSSFISNHTHWLGTTTRKKIVALHGSPPFVDMKYTTETQWRKAIARLISYFLTSNELLLIKKELMIHNEITLEDLKKHLSHENNHSI
jgi:hypothetical protein